MEGRLRDAGFSFSFPAIRVKFRPTAKVLRKELLLPAKGMGGEGVGEK
jgi:hypothetical protein